MGDLGIFSKLNSNFETRRSREVASVDDLDEPWALKDELEIGPADGPGRRAGVARRGARSACSTQGNRSENCCVQEKTPRKITACSLRFDPETGCLVDPDRT